MSVEKSLDNLISLVKEMIEQKSTDLIFTKQKQEFLEYLLEIKKFANTLTGEKKQMFLVSLHIMYLKKTILIEQMEEMANTLTGERRKLFFDGIEEILDKYDDKI